MHPAVYHALLSVFTEQPVGHRFARFDVVVCAPFFVDRHNRRRNAQYSVFGVDDREFRTFFLPFFQYGFFEDHNLFAFAGFELGECDGTGFDGDALFSESDKIVFAVCVEEADDRSHSRARRERVRHGTVAGKARIGCKVFERRRNVACRIFFGIVCENHRADAYRIPRALFIIFERKCARFRRHIIVQHTVFF